MSTPNSRTYRVAPWTMGDQTLYRVTDSEGGTAAFYTEAEAHTAARGLGFVPESEARVEAAGRVFVNLRATGVLPDGRMCPMTGLPEHLEPSLPTMREVREHNARQTNLGACIVLPYSLLAIR